MAAENVFFRERWFDVSLIAPKSKVTVMAGGKLEGETVIRILTTIYLVRLDVKKKKKKVNKRRGNILSCGITDNSRYPLSMSNVARGLDPIPGINSLLGEMFCLLRGKKQK